MCVDGLRVVWEDLKGRGFLGWCAGGGNFSMGMFMNVNVDEIREGLEMYFLLFLI